VTGLTVGGDRVADPSGRIEGSLRKIDIDVSGVGEGEDLLITVQYDPLAPERNVGVFMHLPWGVLTAAAESPAALADYLKSLHTTVVQPLLRDSFGRAWYRGMPEDRSDPKLADEYEGDFLADLIRECHARDIDVVAGIYFDNATPLRQHPEAARIGRDGEPIKNRWGSGEVCFNRPEGREHNLATIRHLLSNWEFSGIILDDSFEMDKRECFCSYCRAQFEAYCAANGLEHGDPATVRSGPVAANWRACRRDATMRLAAEVSAIAHEHSVSAGGWVGASMNAMHLGKVFDFLGGMVYAQPPRTIIGPLSVLGDCEFVCLLWGPNSDPAQMEAEVREAVFSGAAAVGFWIRGDDGDYRMDAERTAAMQRSLGRVEEYWGAFYREHVVSGDGRFAVVAGSAGPEGLRITVRNTGSLVDERVQGAFEMGLPRAEAP
jgi:hypothetical protein